MKKYKKFIIPIGLFIIISGIIIWFFLTLPSNCGNPYCLDGRETVTYFGDGRFVVLEGYAPNEKGDWVGYYDFYDQKTNESVDDIYNYATYKPYVYTVGDKGYTKLNYETGEYLQSHDLSSFSQNDQEIFTKIQNGKPLPNWGKIFK